jgi:hypothetical protein
MFSYAPRLELNPTTFELLLASQHEDADMRLTPLFCQRAITTKQIAIQRETANQQA